MKNEQNKNVWCSRGSCASDAVYGFGVLGAIVYFVQHAPTLTEKIVATFKAVIWPALVVYHVLDFLKM